MKIIGTKKAVCSGTTLKQKGGQTMPEYIEREAAIRIAEKHGLTSGSSLGRHSGVADWIADELADIPAADVEPVRHGQWKLTNTMDTAEDALYCSQCKYIAWVGHGASEHRTPYCPNCGAKMSVEN